MNEYKLCYKTKSKINNWVIFNNFTNSFLLSALIFPLSMLLLIWLDDYYEFVIPTALSISAFAVGFAIQMIAYARSSKSVTLSDDKIIIHFGFYEFGRGGYAEYNKKIKLDSVSSCTVETEHTRINLLKFFLLGYDNKTYNEQIIEITAGDYSKPYVNITINETQHLLLPADNADALCNAVNERIQAL